MPAAQSGIPTAGMLASHAAAAGSGTTTSRSKAPTTTLPAPAAGSGGAAAAAAGGGAMSTAAAGASAVAGASAAAGGAAPAKVEVGHPERFIASIHGSADKLVYVDVKDAKQNWELAVPDGIQDFQLIGGNKLLVGYKFSFGFLEVDLATHKMTANVRDFLTRDEAILTSVKRLPNGHTIIMAQGLAGGAKDLEVWEVDNDKMVHDKRSFKGCCGNLRVVRMTSDNHFLVGSDQALVELNEMGKEIKRLMTGGSPTYMGLKTADGTYYATNGHGGQVLAFPMGGQKKVLGGKTSSSASMVTIYQPGQFQILQNGNIVTTNWTAEDGGRGQQLVEYDPAGNMVWSWDDAAVRPQGMETVLVLDNLDPSVLNDDRDGVLEPQP
ncbi:MAG TPA: hypothetical protein VFN67_22100 [Polyangiales bacterium]|nr:hypothetical protein [Polyangiales bacterium]